MIVVACTEQVAVSPVWVDMPRHPSLHLLPVMHHDTKAHTSSPGSIPGPSPHRPSLKCFRTVGGNPGCILFRCPNHLCLLLAIEAQRLYFNLHPEDCMEEAHICHLYPRPEYLCHYPELVAICKVWEIDWAVYYELYLLTQLSLLYNRLIQCQHYCWCHTHLSISCSNLPSHMTLIYLNLDHNLISNIEKTVLAIAWWSAWKSYTGLSFCGPPPTAEVVRVQSIMDWVAVEKQWPWPWSLATETGKP